MAACAVVFVLLLGLLIDSALYYGKIHAGVTISGRSMSGLTRDEATATLTRLVDFAADSPITLTNNDDTWTVKPSNVGTEIDVAGAVTAAMNVTRGNNFLADGFRRIILYFTDRDVPLAGTVDDAMMEEVLAGIAEDIDVPPVNPGLAIEGTKIRVIEGKKGRVVDQERLREELESLVLTLHSTELAIPMIVKEPSMTVEDTRPAVVQAETMVSGPVKVTHGTSPGR